MIECARRASAGSLVSSVPPSPAGQHLARLVAERAERADRSGAAVVPPLPVRVGAVLHDRQVVAVGDRGQGVHVAHLLAEVHRHQRARPRRDRRLHRRRIDRPALGLDVDDHRQRACGDRGVRGRRERQGGDDHLVAPADAERLQRDLHRHRAVRHDDAVLGALVRREPLGELRRPRAGLRPAADLAVADDVRHRLDVAFRDLRPRRERLAADWCCTTDCEVAHRAAPSGPLDFRPPGVVFFLFVSKVSLLYAPGWRGS